jgi:hypothetical protein
MADLWDKVKRTVTEIYTTASGKAVEGVNLGVKKLDEAGLRRELSKEFAGLGGRAYQLLRREEGEAIAGDPTVRHHMERLGDLEKRLEELEQEIHEIRRGKPVPPEAVEQTAGALEAPPSSSSDSADAASPEATGSEDEPSPHD